MGKGEINTLKNQEVASARGIHSPLPKRLYTLPESARYLGRSLWSMRELCWAGKIPIVRDGKRIFVDITDLDSYISKNKTTYI